MLNRSTLISAIIKKRRPLAMRIERVETNLQYLTIALQQAESFRTHLKSKADNEKTLAALEGLNFLNLQAALQTQLTALGKLKQRFIRNTLNIGVIGRARQGKSRLLQSLTQLTKVEIPDGDRQHCTGVRSTIYHTPQIEPYGKVTFHTERSFLAEVIAPYYDQLQLGTPPATLEAFERQPIPGLPPNLDYAETKAKHEYLRRYRSKFQEYGPLLRQTSPVNITRNQIREHVAQDDLSGERVYFKYMAVKEVEIFCPFANGEVEQIALVDMPGLGDTGIGDAARLVAALGQDVDVVMFVRMPNAKGDSWQDVDVQLYDIAKKSLVELPIHLWSFAVLNQTDANSKNGDNRLNCGDLEHSIQEKHIDVVGCMTADCSKPEAASVMLDRVLSHLVEHIESLDKRYAESRQLALLDLHRTINDEFAKAQRVLGQYADSKQLFKTTFNDFWEDLTEGLEGLLREIREMLGKDDAAFKTKVTEVLRKCREDAGLPPASLTLDQRRDHQGDYTAAYADYLRKIRTDLSGHFLALDGQIQYSLNAIKLKIIRKLLAPPIGLKIIDPQDPQALKAIAQQVHVYLGDSNLELGFQTLADFNVSFAGIIQRQLRGYLDELTADRQPLQESTLGINELLAIAQVLAPITLQSFLAQYAEPTWLQLKNFVLDLARKILDPNPEQAQVMQRLELLASRQDMNGEQVLERLRALHEQTVANCEEVLISFLKEPNYIAYAMTAEFVDRVLRAGRKKLGDVRDEWELFLGADEIKPQIWSQFQQEDVRKQEQREWKELMDAVSVANAEERYHFLE